MAELSDPQTSLGLRWALGAWLLVPILLALIGLADVLQVLGDAWAQQGTEWSAPVQNGIDTISGTLVMMAMPWGVVCLLRSAVDMWRHQRWSLLGITLSVALILCWMAFCAWSVSGFRQIYSG